MSELRNRVVQVKRFGGPDELEVVDAPLPTARRDEVRVRVLASSIEYTDVTIRRHLPAAAARRLMRDAGPPMAWDIVAMVGGLPLLAIAIATSGTTRVLVVAAWLIVLAIPAILDRTGWRIRAGFVAKRSSVASSGFPITAHSLANCPSLPQASVMCPSRQAYTSCGWMCGWALPLRRGGLPETR